MLERFAVFDQRLNDTTNSDTLIPQLVIPTPHECTPLPEWLPWLQGAIILVLLVSVILLTVSVAQKSFNGGKAISKMRMILLYLAAFVTPCLSVTFTVLPESAGSNTVWLGFIEAGVSSFVLMFIAAMLITRTSVRNSLGFAAVYITVLAGVLGVISFVDYTLYAYVLQHAYPNPC